MSHVRITLIAAAATSALVLAGCGDPDPVNQTHNGELSEDDSKLPDDDSFYDEYTFEVAEGWPITINMNSDDFDTYLMLRGPENQDFGQHDDIVPGQNLNSQIQTTAPVEGTYTLIANSAMVGETGAYTLTIQAGPGGGS